MSLPSILTHVGPSTGTPVFRLTQLASRVLDAPVSLLVVKSDGLDMIPMAGMGEGMTGAAVEKLMSTAEADAEAARATAQAAMDKWPDELSVSLIESMGRPYDVVAQYGRMHGLTVVGHGGKPGADDALDAVLYRSGRPALIAPSKSPDTLGARIAVFWNDSPEAAKAFWAAYPFMRTAEKVRVFACDEGFKAEEALDRFQKQLNALNIEIETTVLPAPASGSVGAALQAGAVEMDADLIVMGSHGRRGLEKLVLGSVAQRVLAHATQPVLIVRD